MFAKIQALWAESKKQSEMRVLRKAYLRKTGKSLDKYTDEQIEEMKRIGELLKKHGLSADDVINYFSPNESGKKA